MGDIAGGIADAYNTAAGYGEDTFDAATPDTGPWLRDEDGNDVFQGGMFDEDPLWERTDAEETVVEHDWTQAGIQTAQDAADAADPSGWGPDAKIALLGVGVLAGAYILGQLFTVGVGM